MPTVSQVCPSGQRFLHCGKLILTRSFESSWFWLGLDMDASSDHLFSCLVEIAALLLFPFALWWGLQWAELRYHSKQFCNDLSCAITVSSRFPWGLQWAELRYHSKQFCSDLSCAITVSSRFSMSSWIEILHSYILPFASSFHCLSLALRKHRHDSLDRSITRSIARSLDRSLARSLGISEMS